MRISRREKPTAPAATAHDIDCRHLWRQLRTAAWKAKRSTGIQTERSHRRVHKVRSRTSRKIGIPVSRQFGRRVQEDSCDLAISQNHFATWAYSSPGDSNVFVGENAVVEYTFHSGLLAGGDSDEDVRGSEHGLVPLEPSVVAVTMSFGPPRLTQAFSCQRTQLSRFWVLRCVGCWALADSCSEGIKSLPYDEQTAEASLQMLSGASERETDGEHERVAAHSTPPRRRTRIHMKPNAEDSSDYEDYGSDESDSVGICDDDHDSEEGKFDDEVDHLSDCGAAEMDQAFLASLHVGHNALSKQKHEKKLCWEMQWTPASTEFKTDAHLYAALGAEEARPVGELLNVWRSPLLALFYVVPKSLWVSITTETNRYSLQQVDK
ncbi:LOW QUALITY PROTEIN: Hypothetical protein PHPALM_19587 [Phytophthora palmivora]|uniref:Uncharacterized protein n=1 Tax=Phytophthora palmivora TaxID=4796 RepID=A0A2P4XH13_9STRA|nr:LOW QUALITY PROTEIN: Hypothetical protein PHPALM_19587 [Phytophthora palmivora]